MLVNDLTHLERDNDNGQPHVLVVEYLKGSFSVTSFLRDRKLFLETAGDAERALEFARGVAGAFNIILLDDMLPPTAGATPEPLSPSFVGELMAICPDALLIALMNGQEERRAEVLRAGAFHCLVKPFAPDELSILLERASDHKRLADEAREKRELARLMQATNSLFNCTSREEIVACVVSGVHSIGFDRVRLYVPSTDGRALKLEAQYGTGDGDVGSVWENGAKFLSNHFGEGTRTHYFDPACASSDMVREPFGDTSVGWILAPLTASKETIAVVTADNAASGRPITEKDLNAVEMFASQAAAALQVAKLLRETRTQVAQLESLRHTTLSITERRDRNLLLQIIIEEAVKLLRAKNGGIYKYSSAARELIVITDFLRPERIGVKLQLNEGIAGRLVAEALEGESEKRFESVQYYSTWEHRATVYEDKHPYGSVIEVLLRWNGEIVGILYIDDEEGREFTHDDERLLGLFADQASIAIGNAELIARDEEKMRGLRKLSRATGEIMGRLAEKPLGARLDDIVRHAAEILNAEVCYLALVKRPGWLSLEASHGHAEEGYQAGRELKIQGGPGLGLLGHIAHLAENQLLEGDVFNEHGDTLRSNPAVRGGGPPTHLPSGKCHSLLVVPLWEKAGGGRRLLGLLCANNKCSSDTLLPTDIKFTDADVWMLQVFGEAAVVALGSARLVAELRKQREELEVQKNRFQLLVSNSPAGMIVNDLDGRVTLFNERASEILGYTQEEAIGMPAAAFFAAAEEPHHIGRLLHQRGGRVIDYQTKGRDKFGNDIPLKHSSTWLYDAAGKRVGSVGYFEDMRRMELLLKSSSIVAQAEAHSLGESLRQLAELTATCLPHIFCRILLLDDERQSLKVAAAHGLPDAANGDGGEADTINLDDEVWPRLRWWLDNGGENVLRAEQSPDGDILDWLSRHMRLDRPVQALLLLPLRAGDSPRGLVEFGSLRPRHSFTTTERDLARALTEKVTLLLDRMRLLDDLHHRGEQLEALYEASLRIRADKDTDRLLHEIVRIAITMVGCKAGGLYVFNPLVNDFELKALHSLPEGLKDSRPPARGLVIEVARSGRWQVFTPAQPTDEVIPRAAVPLKNEAGDVEAVLFTADMGDRHGIGHYDIEALQRFAAQASVALQISRLLTQEQRTFSKLTTLNRISTYLQTTRDVDKMLHALLTGVTANYGLQFNRAALLLRERGWGRFVGRTAVGHVNERQARDDWEQNSGSEDGVKDFAQYLQLLDREAISPTPLERVIRRVVIGLDSYHGTVFSDAVRKRRPVVVGRGEEGSIPPEFGRVFEPSAPLVIVPLEAHNRVIGLLIADNKFTGAPVSAADVKLLVAFANTAAIAYDKAQHIAELEMLNRAVHAMALPFGRTDADAVAVEQVLQTIVEQTRRVLSCDSATIWSFDQGEGKFLPEELRASGIPKEALDVFRELEPWRQGTTYKVLEEGWVAVEDVDDPIYDFIRPEMRQHLRDSGVRAFQGIAMRAGSEPVGVLYSSYSHPRPFGEEDRRSLDNFSTYAALSLRNARLLDQVILSRKAAQVVAEVTALGDYEETLCSIAAGMLAAVGCHAVVLYAYDPTTGRWKYPPTHAGVWFPQRAWPNDVVPEDSIVNFVLNRNEPYIAERVAEDPLLRRRRFARDEEIESCVALPLMASGTRLGVMFVNYRSRNRFSRFELSNIKLFADQAAVAIRNAQLFERQSQLLRKQHNLLKMSEELLLLNDEQRILDRAVEIAGRALGVDYCNIVLPDRQGRLIFRAGYKWERGLINKYELPKGNGSQTGYTIAIGRPVVVQDYSDRMAREFDVPEIVFDRGLKSGLSVPMFSAGVVTGSMLIHTRKRRNFDEEDISLLRVIANQTAVALDSARRLQSVRRQLAYLEALYQAGQKLSAGFGATPKEVLQSILNLAIDGLTSGDGKKPFLGTIELYDEKTHEMVLESIYPPESHPQLLQRIKERRPLDPRLNGGRIGITGLAVLNGRAYIVDDVSNYADQYVEYDSRTVSELVVPLRSGNKVVGVINIESDLPAAFDKGDRRALAALSDMAAIAIKSAEQFAELRQTKGLVGARTALAWMGMMTSLWRHNIERWAQDIINEVRNTRTVDNGDFKPDVPGWLRKKLEKIGNQTAKIKSAPTVPVLSAGDAKLFELSEFVRQRLKTLWDGQHRYHVAELRAKPDPSVKALVHASRDWIGKALDILLDNALDEVETLDEGRRWVRVGTRMADGGVELIVSDGGRGIPTEISEQIFNEPVKRADDQPMKGLGMGLLTAQVIVEAYAGRLYVGTTGPEGTSMVIWLPTQAG